MPTRRYLLAPSLARLVHRDLDGHKILEGHFPSRSDAVTFVSVAKGDARLVLVEPGRDEAETRLSLRQGETLLDGSRGVIEYDRVTIGPIGGITLTIDRFDGKELAIVAISGDGSDVRAPSWFGREITDEEAYGLRQMALEGAPPPEAVVIEGEAVEDLLDLMDRVARPAAERRGVSGRVPDEKPTAEEDASNAASPQDEAKVASDASDEPSGESHGDGEGDPEGGYADAGNQVDETVVAIGEFRDQDRQAGP